VPERVWQETEDKALREPKAGEFSKSSRLRGVAADISEIDALFGVPQPAQWHPEIDTGVHTLMVLDQAALLSAEPTVRFRPRWCTISARARRRRRSGRATADTRSAAFRSSRPWRIGCGCRANIATSASS